MRELTKEEIEKLASGKGVRRIAVENFLMSMTPFGEQAAIGNLYLDAQLYRWNTPTIEAIRIGIRLATK